MKTLGIIIARAGSVGLSNKHLRPLLGRPVIQYTLDYATRSERLDRVAVSSDSPQVRAMGAAMGFDAVKRPAALATGEASVQAVLLHAMQETERSGGFRADAIVLLYGNCPVRPEGLADQAVELLEQTGCDSVRSFAPVGKLHPHWMSRLDGDRVEQYLPGSIHRRQDLEPLYYHDGAVVAVTRNALLRQLDHPDDPHAFFGVDRRGIAVKAGQTVEIDQEMDLFLAEAVLSASTRRFQDAFGEAEVFGEAQAEQ